MNRLVVGLSALLFCPIAAVAQVSPAPSSEVLLLLQRLGPLEPQNQGAEEKVGQRDAAPPATTTPIEAAVKKAVDAYLKAEAERKKKEEESKKKVEEALGFEVGKDLKMSAMWRDGVHFETVDKAFRFTVGGRVDFDSTWYSASEALVNSIGQFNNYADPNLGLADGAEFRRARLRFQGTLWEVMEFNTEFDFANVIDLRRRTLGIDPPAPGPTIADLEPAPGVRLTDLWLGFNQLPILGTVRAGHQKEWITFTNATSGRWLTFLERPLLYDAFNDDFQFSDGITVQRNFFDQRVYAWAGFFRVNSRTGAFDSGDGEYAGDVRLTCVPVWDEEDDLWVHLGIDYSYRTLHLDQTRFRARPLVQSGTGFQVPNILNTGILFSRDSQQVVNFEFASGLGPITLASEFALSWVQNAFVGGLPPFSGPVPDTVKSAGNYLAKGWYIEALYFLTGEHRGYRREQPGYDRIRPAEPFFCVHGDDGWIWGRGAWEVGVRYDWLDLTDGIVNGGSSQAVTLGLNWHLNPNMKVQWNYVWMDRDFDPPDDTGRREGSLQGLAMRFHWDF